MDLLLSINNSINLSLLICQIRVDKYGYVHTHAQGGTFLGTIIAFKKSYIFHRYFSGINHVLNLRQITILQLALVESRPP